MTNEERRHQIKFFINKFEAIPEQMWMTDRLGTATGPRCAIGHCMVVRSDCSPWGDGRIYWGGGGDESEALRLLDLFAMHDVPEGCRWVASINNGFHPAYAQPTPKSRILAALHDKLKECL